MPDLRGSDAFYTVATRLQDAVLARFDQEGQPRPARSYITTGQVAWDVCDCGGQLAVTIVRTWLASSFPGEGATTVQLPPCEIPYRVAELQVHLTRCAANPDDSGVPAAAELTTVGRQVTRDAWAVQAGVLCGLDALQDEGSITDFVIGTQVMTGPQGGCVGSFQPTFVGLVNVCPC